MDHEDIDLRPPEQPQALLHRAKQMILILCIKGLRPPSQLGGQDVRLRHIFQGHTQHLLAITIAGRRIHIIDPQLQSASNRRAGLLVWASHRRHKEAA